MQGPIRTPILMYHSVTDAATPGFGRFVVKTKDFNNQMLFLKIGGYNPLFYMADDWNLWTEFAKRGVISSVNEPLVKVRKHSSQRSFFDHGRLQINHAVGSSILLYPFMKNIKADQSFLDWVDSELNKYGYYKKRINFTKVKKSYFSQSNFIMKFLVIFRFVVSDFSNTSILLQRFIGLSLTYRLAKKWIKN